MSADLDAIAREAANKLLTEQWPVMSMFLTKSACIEAREKFVRGIISEAIAQDRKAREAERKKAHDDMLAAVEENRRLCQDLPEYKKQQNHAAAMRLIYAGNEIDALQQQLAQQSAALEEAKEDIEWSCGQLGINPRDNSAWKTVTAALAQLAEAPREATSVEPRALTSGEAVEAIEFIKGSSCYNEFIRRCDNAIAQLRAPSRTEREDTAPEVGGKGGE